MADQGISCKMMTFHFPTKWNTYDNIRPDFRTVSLSECHWELVFLTGTRDSSTEIQKPLPLTGFGLPGQYP